MSPRGGDHGGALPPAAANRWGKHAAAPASIPASAAKAKAATTAATTTTAAATAAATATSATAAATATSQPTAAPRVAITDAVVEREIPSRAAPTEEDILMREIQREKARLDRVRGAAPVQPDGPEEQEGDEDMDEEDRPRVSRFMANRQRGGRSRG